MVAGSDCTTNQLSWAIHLCIIPRAYRPQRGRGHVTAIVLCVPSNIFRQWFLTNYSNSCCLYYTMDFTTSHQCGSIRP